MDAGSEKHMMHYRSVDDMSQVILRNLERIPSSVDLVVGIPRSGLLAATMISLYLNRPLTDLTGLQEERLLAKGKRAVPGQDMITVQTAHRILVVDDCVSQGAEMRRAKSVIDRLGLSDRTTYLSVFSFPENPELADITLQVIPRPMCFQWSFMHTPELKRFCLDIDGVLCRDPTPDEDDDGANYEAFLRSVSPKFLPTAEVGWLVTSRLEKYRTATEDWLARHGVKYTALIMLDLASAAERRARPSIVVDFKAEAYRRSGALLFVESSPGHAKLIAQASGRPVMCMTTNRVIGNPEFDGIVIVLQRISHLIRRSKRIPHKLLSVVSGMVRRGNTVKPDTLPDEKRV